MSERDTDEHLLRLDTTTLLADNNGGLFCQLISRPLRVPAVEPVDDLLWLACF